MQRIQFEILLATSYCSMSFKGTLLKPQVPAAEKLMNRRQMLLAWEQGTGKTIISLAAADRLLSLKRVTSALVLAPGGSAWQWEDKIHEFTDRDAKVAIAKKKDTRTYEPISGGFYVVPYSLFRRDWDKIVETNWDLVIADEAQEFSNFKSVTAQKIKKLNVKVKPTYRWALTGTAVSNKLEELYSIMYWVDPKVLGPWPTFYKNHSVQGAFGEIKTYKNLEVLNKHLLSSKMDRKTAEDMDGHMPKIVYEVITISRTKEYEQAEKELLYQLDKLVDNITFDEEGNPQLPPQHPVRKAFAACRSHLWTSGRREEVLNWAHGRLAESGESKVVLFSSTKKPLYELEDEFNGAFSKYATLFTGDQDTDEKRAAVTEFRGGPARVLLCSDAGNSGLDLPEARYLGNINTPLSFGQSDQRDKRIARLSSAFPFVVVTNFVMEGMEMFFYQATKRKGELAGATLDGKGNKIQMRPQSLRNYLHEVHDAME